MLPRAACSSRARRLDNSLDISAMTNRPMPARPDCVSITALPVPAPLLYQDTSSRSSATAAAVANASSDDAVRRVAYGDAAWGGGLAVLGHAFTALNAAEQARFINIVVEWDLLSKDRLKQ